MNEVRLTEAELLVAAHVGVQRRLRAVRRGRQHRWGYDPQANWSTDIEAAAAELLVAKVRGRYWSDQEQTDAAGDVGLAQVRHTHRLDGCLLLHPEDSDDAPFVLVVGASLDMAVAGWIYGRDGKAQQFWREDTGRPAFFVPQPSLRSV